MNKYLPPNQQFQFSRCTFFLFSKMSTVLFLSISGVGKLDSLWAMSYVLPVYVN